MSSTETIRRPVSDFEVGHRLSALFLPFPFVCFTLALLTDLAFWRTAYLMWQNFSAWLLFAGLVFGGIGILAAIVDWLRPATRPARPSAAQIVLFLIVLVLAVINSFIHAGDGWTAVVPNGLILSAVTFLFILITLWQGRLRSSRTVVVEGGRHV